MWDTVSGEAIVVLRGHKDRVKSAWFSMDGELVVTASDDNTARVWEVSNGEILPVLHGHRGDINSAQFSPNFNEVVTASSDGTVRIHILKIEDLIALAKSRLNRDLTCDERVQFLNENRNCPKE